MEMLDTLVEAVFLSFLIGAILGGVVVAHFVAKPQTEAEDEKLQPVKIRSDRDNG